jgi:hypothetical protein
MSVNMGDKLVLRLNRCLAIILLVACNHSSAILANEFDAIGMFGDWSAFSDRGACWASSVMHIDGQDEVLEDRLITVSFFDRSGIPEVSFFLADREDRVESALVVIGGHRVELYPDDQFFITDEEWSETLLKAVISDQLVQVHLGYRSGATEIYEPSARGFQDAYIYAWRACGLRRPENLLSSP